MYILPVDKTTRSQVFFFTFRRRPFFVNFEIARSKQLLIRIKDCSFYQSTFGFLGNVLQIYLLCYRNPDPFHGDPSGPGVMPYPTPKRKSSRWLDELSSMVHQSANHPS